MAKADEFSIVITGAGAVTCVGFDLASTTAAIESGIDGFKETQFFDELNQPLIGAPIPTEDPKGPRYSGLDRPARYVAMAIEEAFERAGVETNHRTEALIIYMLPEFSHDDALLRVVLAETEHRLGCDLFGDRHKLAAGGAVGIGRALAFAKNWIAKNPNQPVVIAAFDTWLHVARINQGLSQQRFLDSDSSDGLIPGEAASAILLQSSTMPRRGTSLEISGVGLAMESKDLKSQQLGTGVELGKAIRQALELSDVAAHEIRQRLANVTGEEYFFTESSYAWSRVLRTPLPEEYRYQLISSSIGEVGSAFGPLILGYAMQSCQDFRLNDDPVLIQLSSAGPNRSAIVGKVVLQPTDENQKAQRNE